MKTSDFIYELPQELIAQYPAKNRDESRLMVVKNSIEHTKFLDIVDYLNNGDVLVLNETKVIEAKLIGKKLSGAYAEIILTKRIDDKKFESRIKSRNPIVGSEFVFELLEISKNKISEHDQEVVSKKILDRFRCRVIAKDFDVFTVEFDKKLSKEKLKEIAVLPSPPYIKKQIDYERYQTVYADKEGSVAAPTAGLHFTDELINKIKEKGVKIAKLTLHVGFGTFIPLRTENVEEHKMEKEYFEIDSINKKIINECKGRLVCVGTTSMRALESMCENGKIVKDKGWADLFIYPGYKFKSNVSMLITNFHLPKSTLLLLVSAFAGKDIVFNAYKEAIKEKYRFFSFGDAMLLFRKNI